MDLVRCAWCGTDPFYQKYHDEEWGVPLFDDRKLFEFLTLEGAQAGLSWITILRRRQGYHEAFANFDPEIVARFTEKDFEALMNNGAIIRNRLKVKAAINNAQRFLEVQEEFGSFANYQWAWVHGVPIQNKIRDLKQIQAITPLAEIWSKDLKARGFQFIGPTVLYAHMQATGMVNDHVMKCFRYDQVRDLSFT